VKSALTLATVTLVALIASARPADANILDWMHEWSGPGPFDGKYPVIMLPVCKQPFRALDSLVDDPKCFFLDIRGLVAEKNDNFPVKVDVTFVDFGRTWRLQTSKLQRSMEVGIGAGFMVATGDKNHGGKTATRFTVTAPRVVVKPVLLIAELFGSDGPRIEKLNARSHGLASAVKLYIGGTVTTSPLDADDLVSGSASTFHRKAEYVLSRGLVIDFRELFYK
jgi:hypothetical protein